MPSRLVAVSYEAYDPARLARFWADLLGRTAAADGRGVLLPGDATRLGLRFVPGRAAAAVVRNRMHLHLTSETAAHQRETVAAALRHGARHLDVGQRPEDGHVVLADPEGNEFCVIEPGNAYLAGTGFLGELACEGSRDTGLFWSAALGWPLVWDRDGETAVQSPHGGTKVAWGGPPVPPPGQGVRQRFELAVDDADPAAEAGRLAALGATPVRQEPGAVLLADPDGAEFRLDLASPA